MNVFSCRGCVIDPEDHLAVYMTRGGLTAYQSDDDILFPALSLVRPNAGNTLFRYSSNTFGVQLATSPVLIFENGFQLARTVSAGEELTLWYTEVFHDVPEGNNGTTCANIYFRGTRTERWRRRKCEQTSGGFREKRVSSCERRCYHALC